MVRPLAEGPLVLPALLLCDFGHLADEVARLEAAAARALHLDVMDGHFVPQLTYGPVVVEAVRRATDLPIDVHLMIEQPEATLADYVRGGADVITVHVEAVGDPLQAVEAIHAQGVAAHLAISPGTPLETIEPALTAVGEAACDGVLVMSVEPGFGGQAFIPEALNRLAEVRAMAEGRGGPRLRLGVDGGISLETIAAAAAAADYFVAGSSVIRTADYAAAIRDLEHVARGASRA